MNLARNAATKVRQTRLFGTKRHEPDKAKPFGFSQLSPLETNLSEPITRTTG